MILRKDGEDENGGPMTKVMVEDIVIIHRTPNPPPHYLRPALTLWTT